MATNPNDRPRYYEGQYLSAEDLSALLDYLRSASARHALGGHVWGIAIGLQLTERTAPGGVSRVEVTLQPGHAWDGFGRPLTNGRPTRLPEALFADIPYNPVADDVAAGGTGRLVQVWLAYDESASRNPAPGFETCATDNQRARISESFRFEIGPQTVARQRDRITIGPTTMDAEAALVQFDADAKPLHDTSVPHQNFPLDGKPPRWLVPIGYVRWIAKDGALGYFAERGLAPADKVEGRIRAARRYIGSVAEYIEAADGAIVLHRRSDDPNGPHRFAALLNDTLDPAALLDDLVWVEGNLRALGDVRLAGGRAVWRNGDGGDEGTDFYIQRKGDNPSVPIAGNREFDIAIGPVAQTNNRLIIGPALPIVAPATQADLAPRLVVVSSGDVGIGRADPETRLNIVGDRMRVQNSTAANARKVDLGTQGSGVALESPTSTLTIRAFGPAVSSADRVLINPENTDGPVGIRVAAPQHDVDAKGRSIKLGLEQDGGGQMVFRHTAPNQVLMEARNAAGTASAQEMRITGAAGANLPYAAIQADVAYVSGHLAVGLPLPAYDMDVRARSIKLGLEANGGGQLIIANNLNDNRIYLEGFSTDGSAHATEMLVTGRWAQRLPQFTVRAASTLVDSNELAIDCPAGQQMVLTAEVSNGVSFASRNSTVAFAEMRNLFWPRAIGAGWLTVRGLTFVNMSDEHAKEDIRPLSSALDRVMCLRGVSYRFRGEGRAQTEEIGLIAQEVREIVPEAVSESDGHIGISYAAITPLLIESIKALKQELDALREEVKALTVKPAKPVRRRASSS